MTIKNEQASSLVRDVIKAFDNLNGLHPGFRPAHAKGILLSGIFTPCPGGTSLTRAPHLRQSSTKVTVRFSNFAGVPNIPHNDPNASPRGLGIRFHLGEHVHTDITAHSVDGFPARTAEEFLEFLRAAYESGPSTPRPTPIEKFLATHPAELRFVQTAKPLPTSFAKETFYAVNAYKFTNPDGVSRYGRYRIRPEGESEYLTQAAGESKSANFLFDEIIVRLAKGPAALKVTVQIASAGDAVDDATVQWPEDRPRIEFGSIQLTSVVPNNEAEQRRIIFDPIPRVNGIDASGDPLLEPRAEVYLASGRRRRASGATEGS